MIEVGLTAIQVMTLGEIKSGEIIRAGQERNRKYVSLLAAIFTVAMKIPPVLIYCKQPT